MIFKVMKYLKSVIWYIALAIAVIAGQAYLELQIPAKNIELAAALSLGLPDGANAALLVALSMFLYSLGAIALSIVGIFLSSKISSKFGEILRQEMFKKVQSMAVNDVEKFGTASLITRTTNDITQVQNFINMGIRMVVIAPIMLVGGLLNALNIQWQFSIVYAIAIPIIALAIIFIGFKGSKLFVQVQKKIDNLTVVSRENLTGVRVIRAFNQQSYENEKYDVANKDVTDTSIKVNRIIARLFPIGSLVMNLTTVGILVVASIVFNGQTAPVEKGLYEMVGATSAVIGYSMQILGAIISMSLIFMMLPRAEASANRIMEVLNTKISIEDTTTTSEQQTTVRGKIEFKDVTFSFPNAEKPVLNNISFVSNAGETTAIIGSTGSGKSTIASLIPRFYDPQAGQIFIDDVDIKKMSQQTLRDKIGFVPQSAVLFSGTVSDNIRYGKTDATEEEMKLATDISQATEFVLNTEDGFDHYIAQGGKNLSGGQKQRLAIARAIVRRPEIYVFDDSFSALDYATDAKLRKALREQTQKDGSSVIIIAQRVNTVIDADQIIVMDNGNMVGIGKHTDLMKTCLPYKEIVLSQLNEEEANRNVRK